MDKQHLHVLFIEDSEDDFALVFRELQKGYPQLTAHRVESCTQLLHAIESSEWDVVIADYSLPGFNGLAALKTIREKTPDMPVILVSGTIGEEIAVEAMRGGARDYIMKDNLSRLLPAVERELHEARERQKAKRAEAAYEESESRYRELVELLPQTIYEFDLDGYFTFVNDYGLKISGYTRADIQKGFHISKMFAGGEFERAKKNLREILKSGKIRGHEYLSRRKDGSTFHTISYTAPVYKNGRHVGWRGTSIDITERKQAENALQESEVRYRTLFEEVPVSLWVEDFSAGKHYFDQLRSQGIEDFRTYFDEHPEELPHFASLVKIVDVNKATLDLYEARSKQELFIDLNKLFSKDSYGHFKEELIALAAGKTSFQVDGVNLTLKGKEKFVQLKFTIAPGFEKTWDRVLVSISDLTEREKVNRALQESEKRFRDLFEDAPLMINSFDKNGRCYLWNKECVRVTGLTLKDVNNRADLMSRFYPDPEQHQKALNHMKKADGTFKEFILNINGEPRHQLWANFRLPTGTLISMGHDITDRIKAEKTIRSSEEKYRSLFETSRDGIAFLSLDGRVEDANHAFLTMLDYSLEEIRQLTYKDFTPKKWTAKESRIIRKQILQRGYSDEYEKEFIRKDGTIIPVAVRAWLVRNEKGEPLRMLSIVRDISEQKQTQEILTKLSHAVEQSPAIVIITDVDGNIEYVNPKFSEVTGYSQEEVIGKNPRILKSGQTPKEEYEYLWKSILSGQTWRGEFQNKRKNGELFWEAATISSIKNSQGQITHFLAVKEDITEKKKLEQERRHLQAQIMQAQKLETIGTLAGGIAHDFNNLLTPILGYSDMALNEAKEGSQIQSDLKEIHKAAARAKDLVRQILTFSRQIPQERKPVRIQHILKEALNLMRATIPSYIEIRKEIDNTCSPVLADPTQIHQVIVNLCTNSYQAMRHKSGILSVGLRQVTIDALLQRQHPNLNSGKHICLTISDTGKGMNRATMERIFEPFFTTKTVGEGTGLGLSVVHGIVLSYGGDISVHSEVGRGTTFHIYLPAVEETATDAPPQKPTIFKGNERVLLVDDEPSVAQVGKRILSRLGYRVTVKHDGEEALQHFRRHPREYDVIITDQTMPKITGYQLAEAVRKIRDDIPVLLISGYNEAVDSRAGKSTGIFDYLMKPISAAEISRVLRKALAAKTPSPS